MSHHRSLLAIASIASLLIGCSTPALDVAGTRHMGDYLPALGIRLVLDGKVVGAFHDIQGLDAPTLIGGDLDGDGGLDSARSKRKGRPGRPTYGNITLKRGMVNDASLMEWYRKGGGDCDDTDSCLRKSGSIIYLDREGREVMRYNLFEAWPVRLQAPPYNARTDTHVVEEVELAVETITR